MGYQAMILYVDDNSITVKYTLEDDVVKGYTLHILGINVDPALKSLYNQANADGRWWLPGLKGNQQLGTAKSTEIWVSIRDTGAFMDPRWLRDWWAGCPGTQAPSSTISNPAKPPGYTTTPATPISGGGPNETKLLPGNHSSRSFLPIGSGKLPGRNSDNRKLSQLYRYQWRQMVPER